MAVFPDRIVLKNSTDSQAAIEAAIQTGGADAITQGEIVLGINTSDVKFYTKAGDGSIVSLGGTASASTLGELTDVDLSTPATNGQVIAYNSTSGNWEPVNQSGGGGYTDPLTTDGDIVIRSGGTTTRLGIGSEGQVLTVSSGLPVWSAATGGGLNNVVEDTTPQLGGNLDTNTYYITSASGDVTLAPATGEMVIRGGTSDGKLTLNCTANTHGVSIQSPPHAAAATYTLVLPSTAGTAGQVLTSQGGGQLTWEDAGSGGGSVSALSEVGDVVDYNGLTSFSATGTWSQEVVTINSDANAFPDAAGEWALYEGSAGFVMVHFTDSNATDHTTLLDAVVASPTSYSFRLATGGGSASGLVPLTGAMLQDNGRYRLDFDPAVLDPAAYNYDGYSVASPSAGTGGPFARDLDLELGLTASFYASPPSDGQVLTWVDANNQWEPVSPSVRSLSDFDGVTLEDGAGLIYDAVNGIFKQNQQASDVLSAMAYKFKNTLSGDPSTGHIALDNADPSLATEIRVHKTTTNGVDLTNIFSAGVGTAQGIYIQRKDDASEAHFFRTTGPATDSGTYMTVGVMHVSGTGTFTNNKVMAVGVYAKGESAALAPLSVPSTATDTGTAGDIRYDAGYVYICVAANTWKRTALTSW